LINSRLPIQYLLTSTIHIMKHLSLWLCLYLYLPFFTSISQTPARVNNAELPYFRPVFNQNNQECSQAAAIGYIFTYEINAARQVSGQLAANQYPSFFTYNFLNNGDGSQTGLSDLAWEVAIDNGVPNMVDYGGSMNALGLKGWMTGYDKYYHAMQNRAKSWFKFSLGSQAALQNMKNWLYNHNGTTPGYGGLIVTNTWVSSWKFSSIPAADYEGGKQVLYITTKTLTNGHTFTIVGYDDNIEYDINGDGKITTDVDVNGDGKVDMKDLEKGAFIVANSWGKSWKDNGFVYMMYQACATFSAGIYGVEIVPDYKPALTIKTTISCNKRKRINIVAGISADANATTPAYTKEYQAFSMKNGGDFNMISDVNSAPIELGLDISDLAQKVPSLENARVFLNVVADNTTGLTGSVNSMECIDYVANEAGISVGRNMNKADILPGNTTTMFVNINRETSTETMVQPAVGIVSHGSVLSISGLNPNSSIVVTDLCGRNLVAITHRSRALDLNLQPFKGMAIVKITMGATKIVRKVLVD